MILKQTIIQSYTYKTCQDNVSFLRIIYKILTQKKIPNTSFGVGEKHFGIFLYNSKINIFDIHLFFLSNIILIFDIKENE